MRNYKIRQLPLYNALCAAAHVVQKKDLAAAARVMAAAFSDDASIRYLLGGEKEGGSDWKYFLCVLKAVWGKCVMLSGDEQMSCLLILFPPRLKAVPAIPFLLNGGAALCRTFGAGLFLRSLNYENNCRAVKSRHVIAGTWYCMCFAVAPQRQGQGMGSRLIRPVLDVLERDGAPLYLETHKAVNVDIYRHFGFDTVGVSKIPGTDIVQHSMGKGLPPAIGTGA